MVRRVWYWAIADGSTSGTNGLTQAA